MAASPAYKVYDAKGTYQASCKELEACAALASFYGEGATIRLHHSDVLWTEGKDGSSYESYDRTTAVALQRQQEVNQRSFDRAYAQGVSR